MRWTVRCSLVHGVGSIDDIGRLDKGPRDDFTGTIKRGPARIDAVHVAVSGAVSAGGTS